ncbi:hypothetical protein RAB80_008242 [Fusarium oxysporum f. sp. vasinfectum]|nr:hypothetical protein RAB80_008242 [Fusarium oxysporum f. sp. vasinfectum]KAK2932718.1 hypothetical protein FoTM2_007177 [Fusarium oxysporum f. sp. vasinfectum]
MPPSLKDKGGRLLAFANGGPRTNEAQSGVDVKPTKSEPPQNVPTAPIPRPTSYPREITGLGGRNTAPPKQNYPFSQPPPHHSPVRSTISSPDGRIKADSSDRRVDIFSGSQLDENFMESGLTTPHNEPSDPVKLGPELTRDLKKTIPSHRLPDRNRFHRPPPTSDLFTVGDDLRMNVVSRSQQHNADHMGDGFQDDVNVRHGKLNGHHGHGRTRPDSPARQDSKIPMREEEEHTTPRPKPAKPVVQRTLLESSMPATTNFMSNTSRLDRKRRRPSPEYDDVALNSMTFASLRQQPFDFDPSKDGQKGTGVNADNLEDKLEHFRHLGEKEQHDLFSNMSMENWETSGEWFVHEFSALMQKLLDSRRQKRKIIQEFEQEAANREEAVRLKTQAIDRKLSKMKQDGQRVVEDKTA